MTQENATTDGAVLPPEDARERDLFGRAPTNAPDWSHRRGEPRGLALGWAIYLMMIAGVTFGSASVNGSFSLEAYRVASSRLMLMMMLGVVLLWPMTRLCQVSPRSAVRSVLVDLLVLLLPAQALVWGQVLLSRWPLALCAGVSGLLLGWGLVVGGVLIAGLPSARRSVRIAATSVVLAIVIGPAFGSAVLRARGADGAATIAQWLGPLPAMHAITGDRTWSGGGRPGLSPPDARRVSWTLVVGVASIGAGMALRMATAKDDA